MSNFEVYMCRNSKGEYYLKEFLKTVPKKKKAKAFEYLRLLCVCGNNMRPPYSKHLDEGIYELRPLSIRILYFFTENRKVVITHAFVKKTNKTPPLEIERAKKMRREYREGKNYDESGRLY